MGINWSAFSGALLGTLINLVEVGLVAKLIREVKTLSKDIQKMLREQKSEGEGDKWLK